MDKKETIKQLEEKTGLKAVYQGAPTFSYRIGSFTVNRDGSVVEDEDTLEISIPKENFTAQGLKNLIYMISAKGSLLSKAVGGEFKADRELIEDLALNQIDTVEKLMAVLQRSTGELKGLKIEEDMLTFTGFPQNEDAASYIKLAIMMNDFCKKQKRVSAKPSETDNDKYTFRCFLMSLGMKGDEYKKTRKVLLKNLEGNGAFRTQEQAEKHKEKMNEISKQK